MKDEKNIFKISEIILTELENIGRLPEKRTPVTSNVFATPVSNFGSDIDPRKELARLENELISHQSKLLEKPFNAYVRAKINGEKEKLFFVCRGYTPLNLRPITPEADFINYKSPMGRLVEIDVGDEEDIEIGTGDIFAKVLEKNHFIPQKDATAWDAVDNSIFLESGVFSIDSLLSYLRSLKLTPEQIEALERDDKLKFEKALIIRKGLRRKVIDKIELRDQPILDKYQGEIFRIPIASQLIIAGAPGTGKTTLLIKRISQKSEIQNLDFNETQGLSQDELAQFFHKQNWILFTPTELLKIFLKDAMAKELLPASNELVKVWDDEQTTIGRQILNFLKTGDRGYFVITNKPILLKTENSDLIMLCTSFLQYYYDAILEKIYRSNLISKIFLITPQLKEIISSAINAMDSAKSSPTDMKVFLGIEHFSKHRNIIAEAGNYISRYIDNVVNGLITSMPNIIDKVSNIIKAQKTGEQEYFTDYEDDDFQEIETEPPTNQQPVIAKRQIKKTVRAYSLNLSQNRSFSKNSLNNQVFKEIADKLPNTDLIKEIGGQLNELKLLIELTSGYRILLNSIPRYYQQFRIHSIAIESPFFDKDQTEPIKLRHITCHEADLISYVILKHGNMIINRNPELLNISSRNEILENIKYSYKTTIAIDEATDFSTLQIGSMFFFAHPKFSSVSIAGDLMQRVTPFGLKSWSDLNIITDRFRVNNVHRVYRQSRKLLEIAKVLYKHNIGDAPPFESGFEEDESDPNPLIFYSNSDPQKLGSWVSNRIIEITKINNYRLPSVAIFVADDSEIDYVVDILRPYLEQNSIGIKSCPKGEILGSEGKVRVFSVKYIKGLEFESVFFVDIDDIFQSYPDLFDKYLYVGLTRAASFLAITCRNSFPERLHYIKDFFRDGDWDY
jgi:hypothetical protein